MRGKYISKRYSIGFWKLLGKMGERKISAKAALEFMLLALILVVAAHLRITNLDGFFSYDYDEGVYTESARMIVRGYLPNIHVFSSQPPFFILLIAAFLRLFGMNIVIARLFIVITSLIGIISVHLIAKSIEDSKAGLVGAFILSISPYFLRQSRSVQSEVPSISFVLLGVWLFFKGFKDRDKKYLLLSGVATCFGAMMKLNVGLVVPLILIPLIARKNLKECAFFILGCIIPLLILPLFDLSKVIDQTVIFHFAKPATGTWQSRWASILKTLMMDVGLTLTALIGIVICAIRKGLEGKFTVALTVAAFLFLLCYKAFFQHQSVILVPILAIMSGVALTAPVNLGFKKYFENEGRSVKRLRALIILTILNSALSGLYCIGLGRVVKYDSGLILFPRDNAQYHDAVKIIKFYTNSTDYIITDEQILAFLAERDIPPNLVDTSHMRISSGYLDSETVIRLSEEYNVKVIILWTGRLRRLSGFIHYVEANFQLIRDYGGGREIYVRH